MSVRDVPRSIAPRPVGCAGEPTDPHPSPSILRTSRATYSRSRSILRIHGVSRRSCTAIFVYSASDTTRGRRSAR